MIASFLGSGSDLMFLFAIDGFINAYKNIGKPKLIHDKTIAKCEYP